LLFMAFAAIIYLVFTTVSLVALRQLEKRYTVGVKRLSA
jgi:ABC-type arginine transport system permease subunit